MASAAAFLFFLVTKESVGGWDRRPHLSWSLYGVTLSGDRMSVVSPPPPLSSLSGRARGDGSLVHLILVFVPLPPILS